MYPFSIVTKNVCIVKCYVKNHSTKIPPRNVLTKPFTKSIDNLIASKDFGRTLVHSRKFHLLNSLRKHPTEVSLKRPLYFCTGQYPDSRHFVYNKYYILYFHNNVIDIFLNLKLARNAISSISLQRVDPNSFDDPLLMMDLNRNQRSIHQILHHSYWYK